VQRGFQASAGACKYSGEPCLRHMVLAAVEALPDIRLAMTGAMRQVFAELPSEFDPRKALLEAKKAARGICKLRSEAFGCAGQAPRIKPVPLEAMARRYR
jgi:hypothetical protein